MTVSQVPRQGKEIWTKWEDSRRIRRSPTPFPQAWRLVMARPFGSQVQLSDEIRNKLEILKRASSTPQTLAFRCRIILRAAQADYPSNLQIANELGCDRHA